MIEYNFFLRDRRKPKKITQKEIADELGIRQATVSQWESGKSCPPAFYLPTLARFIGCSIDDLFTAPDPVQTKSTA